MLVSAVKPAGFFSDPLVQCGSAMGSEMKSLSPDSSYVHATLSPTTLLVSLPLKLQVSPAAASPEANRVNKSLW